jgi:hypothetical protein
MSVIRFWPAAAVCLAVACGPVDRPSPGGAGADLSRVVSPVVETPQLVLSDFNDANGWKLPQYYQTIHFLDLNGDFVADMCARGIAGILCSIAQTNSTFSAQTLWSASFSDTDPNGWTDPSKYSTISFPDINGDGYPDVCGRGKGGIYCALSGMPATAAFTGFSLWEGDFSDGNGWTDPKYYSTISFPDVNGDGKADLCARGVAGVLCAISNGTSAFTGLSNWASGFSDTDPNGWADPSKYSTIKFPDVDGDGKADVCGRGTQGILCAISNGTTGFTGLSLWNGDFADTSLWTQEKYYSTIAYPRLTGDRKQSICARGIGGIICARSNGASAFVDYTGATHTDVWTGAFSDGDGWGNDPSYYKTIQFIPEMAVSTTLLPGVCGRGSRGVYCLRGNAGETACGKNRPFCFDDPVQASTLESDAANWKAPQYYSTIKIPSVRWDQSDLKLCERGVAGIYCSRPSPAWNPNPFLYGSTTTTANAGYSGPNPSMQGSQYWAMHFTLPELQSCDPSAVPPCSRATELLGPMVGPKPGNVVNIQPVLWQGTSCAGQSSPTVTTAQLTNYYNVLKGSSYINWIQAQYGVANLGALSTVTVNPSIADCSTPIDVEGTLRTLITNGTFGSPNLTTTVFALHFAPNVPLQMSGTCAYNHVSVPGNYINNTPFHYYVVPDYATGPAAGCGSFWLTPPVATLDLMTFNESHEMVETLTDPGIGWRNPTQSNCSSTGCSYASNSSNQVADGCQGTHATINGAPGTSPIVVQGIWSNVGNRCETLNGGAVGDVQGNGRSAIVLGGTGSGAIPQARSRGARTTTFSLSQPALDNAASFKTWEKAAGMRPVAGDFNGDGLDDIALVGSPVICSIPLAFATASAGYQEKNGNYTMSPVPSNLVGVLSTQNSQACTFSQIAQQSPQPRPVAGDFNGDGLDDIALLGVSQRIPVAFSTGDGLGSFAVTDNGDVGLSTFGAGKPLVGDFNGDGYADVALVGIGCSTAFVPVALSNGDGTFSFRQISTVVGTTATADFNCWASGAGVQAVAGDFNADGITDIALAGGSGWNEIRVAYGNDGALQGPSITRGTPGTFIVVSQSGSNPNFASWARTAGAQLVAGDYDGDGAWDLALTGPSTWNSVRVAFSTGTRATPATGLGQFTNETDVMATFPGLAAQSGVVALSGSNAR